MENLGDILRRLATARNISGGDPPAQAADDLGERSDSCDVCAGRGLFTPNVPAGHPDFGRVLTCRCQGDRLTAERSARLLRYSNVGHLARFTFDTLDPRGRADDPESRGLFNEAYHTALEYAEDPVGWLVLAGPSGAGKTHLAAAIANRCIDSGHVVFFVHVPDLLDHLRATFAPTSEISYSDLFEQVRTTPLLIMDGLGSHSSTPWAQEKLHQIVNHRHNAELPTVLTTSTDIAELDPYLKSRFEAPDLSRIVAVRRREPEPVHLLGRIEPEMLRRMTFETFDVRGNNPGAKQRGSLEGAYQCARNYAADPHGWLTLFSDTTGVGKTHLAVAIAVERMGRGDRVFFAFVPELLDYLRYTFTPESRITYDRVFDEVKNTPLLILDDLGRERSSPWAEEKLYQIIVHRHNARRPTIITSAIDFDPVDDDRETGPISSRIRDLSIGDLIRIEAPDYRNKDRVSQIASGREPRRRMKR